MKKIKFGFFAIAFIGLALSSCQSDADQIDKERAAKADNMDPTSIEFVSMEYDFGSVTEGEKVHHVFKFKNTGDKPLFIATAKASCGCTVPEKPEAPIPPGEEGEIKIVFDSQGRVSDNIHKTIRVTANTVPSVSVLNLSGKVISAE